jgi:hypothetical protein
MKDTYKKCVEAYGVVEATVAKVDNGMEFYSPVRGQRLFFSNPLASSMNVILGGKTVSGYAPPLHSKKAKNNIIAGVKREQLPRGLDVTGELILLFSPFSAN